MKNKTRKRWRQGKGSEKGSFMNEVDSRAATGRGDGSKLSKVKHCPGISSGNNELTSPTEQYFRTNVAADVRYAE